MPIFKSLYYILYTSYIILYTLYFLGRERDCLTIYQHTVKRGQNTEKKPKPLCKKGITQVFVVKLKQISHKKIKAIKYQ